MRGQDERRLQHEFVEVVAADAVAGPDRQFHVPVPGKTTASRTAWSASQGCVRSGEPAGEHHPVGLRQRSIAPSSGWSAAVSPAADTSAGRRCVRPEMLALEGVRRQRDPLATAGGEHRAQSTSTPRAHAWATEGPFAAGSLPSRRSVPLPAARAFPPLPRDVVHPPGTSTGWGPTSITTRGPASSGRELPFRNRTGLRRLSYQYRASSRRGVRELSGHRRVDRQPSTSGG